MSGPKARLRVGEYLGDLSAGRRVEGYVLYREWDLEDWKYYYWEEWELDGQGQQDVWVEVDHYTRELSIYEPVHFDQEVDPHDLFVGQTVSLTRGMLRYSGVVKETGTGEVVESRGYIRAGAPAGKTLAYATVDVTSEGPAVGGTAASGGDGANGIPGSEAAGDPTFDIGVGDTVSVTFEFDEDRPLRVYAKRRLAAKQQEELFGRIVYRGGAMANERKLKTLKSVVLMTIVFICAIVTLNSCKDSENVCDPNIEYCDSDDGQGGPIIYHRRGIYGGGGGGVGK